MFLHLIRLINLSVSLEDGGIDHVGFVPDF